MNTEAPALDSLNASPTAAEAHDRFQASVLDQLSDAVVGFGFDARITFWNAAAERLYGFTKAQAIGSLNREVLDYEYPDDTTDAEVGRILLAGGAWVREMQHTTKAGRLFDVHVSLSLRLDEQGTPVGVLAVFRDITELKRARDAAAHTQALFESFMDYSPALAYMKDKEGRFVYASAAVLKQSGLTREQTIGKTAAELWPGAASEQFRRDDLAVWHADKPIKLQYSTSIPPFGLRHWMTYKFPVKDATGRKLVAGLTLDMTERVNAEEQLRERERTYREASETNRGLLTELDHRVRNNLANLIGLLGLMRQQTTDINALADALDSRLHAMAHVHQLMAGTGYQAVELRELAESLLKVAHGIASQAVKVEIDGPAVRVQADQVLSLTLILNEWFTNSCKYGAGSVPGGRVDLYWRLDSTHPAGPRVHLHWQETGGPAIREPVVPSLGTTLVRGFATRELRGTCDLRYPAGGVDHEIVFPTPPAR